MTSNISFLLVLGISVMLMLMLSVLLAVLFNLRKKNQHRRAVQELKEQQQNQLIEAAVRSEETERHRISETLHDEIGAILSSAKLHLLGIKAATLDEKDKHLHDKGAELLNAAIKRVRGISHNLHSNILKEFGFNEAVRHFLKEVAGSSMLEVETQLDDHYPAEISDDNISLYRMVQELVNNIIKHAGAHRLMVSSVMKPDLLTVTLFHDGDGLSQEQFDEMVFQKDGLGLKNIKNRATLIKGSVQFEKKNTGCYIHITMPLHLKPVHHEKDKTGHSG
ncbi:MAG: ATP-binding protein [Chitinophagaceae bacterium]